MKRRLTIFHFCFGAKIRKYRRRRGRQLQWPSSQFHGKTIITLFSLVTKRERKVKKRCSPGVSTPSPDRGCVGFKSWQDQGPLKLHYICRNNTNSKYVHKVNILNNSWKLSPIVFLQILVRAWNDVISHCGRKEVIFWLVLLPSAIDPPPPPCQL